MCVALELFHSFALIHDDIIDNGKERHGKPTTHEYVSKSIVKYPRGDKQRVAEGMAILAGDLIFSWANEFMTECGNDRVYKIYFNMIEEVVVGQMLDVSLTLNEEVKTETIIRKNELKTALYSFVSPMLIGSALAMSHKHDLLYRELGLLLGQAFQIQDDLLDIVGNPNKTGKMTFIDIQEGQHTIASQYIFMNGKQKDKEILLSLFGKPLDDHGRKVLLRLFSSSGAVSYVETEVAKLLSDSRKLVTESTLREDTKAMLSTFINILDQRKS